MKRVAIIGCGGAGKSTLAVELGQRLELPVVHLDQHYWRPHWSAMPKDEWVTTHAALCERPEWIIDGNYKSTMSQRFDACDTIIFLDFPAWRCLGRVLKRSWIHRHGSRPDIAEDCIERLDTEFLRWIWNFRRDVRPQVLARLAEVEGQKAVFILSSPTAVRHFLEQLGRLGSDHP